MATMQVVSAQDGPRVTVSDLIKQPLVIPKRIIKKLENEFVVETLFRNAGENSSGVVLFEESTPMFGDSSTGNAAPEVRAEFGEYPVIITLEGQKKAAVAVDRGFSILVSDEMRRRNQMDRVNTQITQGKNMMIRTWNGVLQAALIAASPTVATTTNWNNVSPKIRFDINAAKQAVYDASLTGSAENYFGFEADTMVCSPTLATVIQNDSTFNNVYVGDLASENILYTGKLPTKILDLDVLRVRGWPNDKVWIGERKTIGFFSDEEPLQSTPLYEDRKSNKTWRSDTNRTTAIGVDQPKAGVILTGAYV